MPDPLVSIITPCYRQARFLPDAIQSVLLQTYSPIEIIVINDGSDDDTESVAARYGDKIKYHWQPNAGLPAARNAAIAQASGKYLLCLDSDDLIDPRAVEWLVHAASGRDDVLCVMGFTRFTNDPRIDNDGDHLPSTDGQLVRKLMLGIIPPPHAHFFSRSMLNAIGGFDVRMRSCEDWDVWLRLVFAGADLIAVPQVGAFYRQHPTSMSRNSVVMAEMRVEMLHRGLRLLDSKPDRFLAIGGKLPDDRDVIQQMLTTELLDLGFVFRNRGQYRRAMAQYCQSFKSGGINTRTLGAILRMGPHWMFRRPGPRTSVAN